MYSGKFSGFVVLDFFPILPLFCFLFSMAYVLLVLNSMSWCFILHNPRHLVNHIVLFFQLTSGLYLASQSCPKNMSVLFKSVTAVSSCSLFLLISISKGTTLVTSLFFVLSALNILNKKLIGFIWILLSFTNYFSILIYVYLELTNALTLRFFPFFILMFAHIFNFFSASLY